jgi:S1-C subfamily serine protease
MTGYPLDFGRVTAFGQISALPSPWANIWPAAYRIDMFGAPGNSGSPVMLADGRVMGILVGGDPNWPGMSIVVPISELCSPRIA